MIAVFTAASIWADFVTADQGGLDSWQGCGEVTKISGDVTKSFVVVTKPFRLREDLIESERNLIRSSTSSQDPILPEDPDRHLFNSLLLTSDLRSLKDSHPVVAFNGWAGEAKPMW
jgi:hypothetical protein